MLLKPGASDVSRPRATTALLILALLGAFAAFDAIGHRSAPYFWPQLICSLAFSLGCLLFARDRGTLDTFLAVLASLFALCAVAVTASDRQRTEWWPWFLCFSGVAALLVLITRKKRETLIAIAAIVGFRFLILAVRLIIRPV